MKTKMDSLKEKTASAEELNWPRRTSDGFSLDGHWQPAVVTDSEGKATLKVQFGSQTTWQTTARVITPETTIGNITHEVTKGHHRPPPGPAVFTNATR